MKQNIVTSVVKTVVTKVVPFTPHSRSDLVAWYRYKKMITITGSGVSNWADVSGNGNDLQQGTDANRPSKESDGSILFDGISQYLKTAGFTLNQPTTIYLLARQVTWTDQESIFDGNTLNSGRFQQITPSPNVRILAGSSVTNTEWTVNTYAILTCIFNGASSSLRVNNNTAVAGNAGAGNMGGFTLGTRGDAAGSSCNLQVKGTLIFDTAHDDSEQQKMYEYLKSINH